MAVTTEAAQFEQYLGALERHFVDGTADGLPVIVPTPVGVQAMVDGSGRAASDVVGVVDEVTVCVRDIATQALMAGCDPTYMPVVLAAMEAFTDPAMETSRWLASTAGLVPWVVVCGPVARSIGMNGGRDAFGPGNRANASIGRAIRLCLRNLLGGTLTAASLGNGYAFSCAIPQDDESFPFEHLQARFGFEQSENVVLAMWTCDPRLLNNSCSEDPEELLRTIAQSLSTFAHLDPVPGQIPARTHAVFAPAYDFQQILQKRDWSIARAREYLAQHTGCPAGDARTAGVGGSTLIPADAADDDFVRFYPDPESIIIVRVGASGAVGQATVAHGLSALARKVTLPASPPTASPRTGLSDMVAFTAEPEPHATVYRYIDADMTDGWGVVPPTRALVAAMVEARGREPDEELGTFEYSGATATVQTLAVNAVLAGCLPEHMPLLVTALEMAIPYGHAHISVGFWSPWFVVNGPLGRALGLPTGTAPFGPSAGRAANTIGRALRLAVMNIGRHRPGQPFDRAVQGQGWKYTLTTFAEDEEGSGWEPLHVRRGFNAGDDVLTFVTGSFGHYEATYSGSDPEALLRVLADQLARQDFWATVSRRPGYFEPRREALLVLGPDHRRLLQHSGWALASVQAFLYEHIGRKLGDLRALGFAWPGRFPEDWGDETFVRALRGPEAVTIVAAGAPGPHSVTSSMNLHEDPDGFPGTSSRSIRS